MLSFYTWIPIVPICLSLGLLHSDRAGHYRRLIDKSTTNLSIDIVDCRLSMYTGKQHWRSVVVGLKFVTDKVALSLKNVYSCCRSVVVGFKFVTDNVA